jgi:hypothetical protein
LRDRQYPDPDFKLNNVELLARLSDALQRVGEHSRFYLRKRDEISD